MCGHCCIILKLIGNVLQLFIVELTSLHATVVQLFLLATHACFIPLISLSLSPLICYSPVSNDFKLQEQRAEAVVLNDIHICSGISHCTFDFYIATRDSSCIAGHSVCVANCEAITTYWQHCCVPCVVFLPGDSTYICTDAG